MKKMEIQDYVYSYLSASKKKRTLIISIRTIARVLRLLKIPFYKNIYDRTVFQSYYPVLSTILENKKKGTYFEWGPGRNTKLAELLMSTVYSVEHDKFWFDFYKNKIAKNTKYIYSPLQNDSYLEYPKEILSVVGKVDVSFVDARCRVECIRFSMEKKVPIVVMHDSLHPSTFSHSFDGTPPKQYELVYCYEGYSYYNFFIEVIDLRTIVLFEHAEDFNFFKNKFTNEYYIRSGKVEEYLTA